MDAEVEVRLSQIHGMGVFALRDFQPGETVLVWDTTHTIDDRGRENLPDEQKSFVARHEGTWIIMQEPMRYVNHSCEANTRPESGKDIATQYIRKGEEITSDYRSEMMKGESMDCSCGSKLCKGYIVGTAL